MLNWRFLCRRSGGPAGRYEAEGGGRSAGEQLESPGGQPQPSTGEGRHSDRWRRRGWLVYRLLAEAEGKSTRSGESYCGGEGPNGEISTWFDPCGRMKLQINFYFLHRRRTIKTYLNVHLGNWSKIVKQSFKGYDKNQKPMKAFSKHINIGSRRLKRNEPDANIFPKSLVLFQDISCFNIAQRGRIHY